MLNNCPRCKENLCTNSHSNLCSLCNEKQTIELLKEDARRIQIKSPPEVCWQNIKDQIVVKPPIYDKPQANKYKSRGLLGMMLAASVGFIFIGYLAWQQHLMKAQLDQVLAKNYLLEEQLAQSQNITINYARLLEQLLPLEQELNQTSDTSQKIELLDQRRLVISAYIANEKEDEYEFKI